MTDHPITPPPELVRQWTQYNENESIETFWKRIATQAARWSADKELEACLQWFSEFYCMETWMQKDLEKFRAARRPKPPSLKEQALEVLERSCFVNQEDETIIRRALEQLDD